VYKKANCIKVEPDAEMQKISSFNPLQKKSPSDIKRLWGVALTSLWSWGRRPSSFPYAVGAYVAAESNHIRNMARDNNAGVRCVWRLTKHAAAWQAGRCKRRGRSSSSQSFLLTLLLLGDRW